MEQSIKRLFEKFLLDNNAYSQYIINLLEKRKISFEEFIYCYNEKELINHAFLWDDTSEGFEFWGKLDLKWRNLLGNN